MGMFCTVRPKSTSFSNEARPSSASRKWSSRKKPDRRRVRKQGGGAEAEVDEWVHHGVRRSANAREGRMSQHGEVVCAYEGER